MDQINYSDILFILNPHSGKKNIKKVRQHILSADPALNLLIPDSKDELKRKLEQHFDEYKVFVVVGGDGTVHEVAKYLVNQPEKYLSVYPNGSGNGFANELGFRRNIQVLLKDIMHGETLDLDVINVNNSLCINMAGVGLDSHVAHAFSRSSRRGFIRYSMLTAKSALTFKSFHASLWVNNLQIEGDYRMIIIANTRQFGNHAVVAPMAKPNDGIFEIVLVKPFPAYLYPQITTRMFMGKQQKSRYIDYIQTKDPVVIRAEYKDYHLDGEPVHFDGDVHLNISPLKVKVIKTSFNKL